MRPKSGLFFAFSAPHMHRQPSVCFLEGLSHEHPQDRLPPAKAPLHRPSLHSTPPCIRQLFDVCPSNDCHQRPWWRLRGQTYVDKPSSECGKVQILTQFAFSRKCFNNVHDQTKVWCCFPHLPVVNKFLRFDRVKLIKLIRID